MIIIINALMWFVRVGVFEWNEQDFVVIEECSRCGRFFFDGVIIRVDNDDDGLCIHEIYSMYLPPISISMPPKLLPLLLL